MAAFWSHESYSGVISFYTARHAIHDLVEKKKSWFAKSWKHKSKSRIFFSTRLLSEASSRSIATLLDLRFFADD